VKSKQKALKAKVILRIVIPFKRHPANCRFAGRKAPEAPRDTARMTVRISRRIVIIFNNVAAYYWTMTLTPASPMKNFLLRCHRKRE
jgi:hypothetical protein